MILRGPRAPCALAQDSYNNRTSYNGIPVTTWRKIVSQCEICNKSLTNASMKRHKKLVYKIEYITYQSPDENVDRNTYRVSIIRKTDNPCPIEGCEGTTRDKFGMYRHFCFRHHHATVIIDGDGPLTKCNLCKMHVKNMNKHVNGQTCKRLQERRRNEELQRLQKNAEEVSFSVKCLPIERVRKFIYLGRRFDEDDNDSACIKDQISKARRQWNCIAKILKRDGADCRTMTRFYLTVVQAVLLYGSDSWTVKKSDIKRLNSFHNRALRYMTGQHIKRLENGEWYYPHHGDLLKKCGMVEIKHYVKATRGTLARYLEKFNPNLMGGGRI